MVPDKQLERHLFHKSQFLPFSITLALLEYEGRVIGEALAERTFPIAR
jgi:hypothetical protein